MQQVAKFITKIEDYEPDGPVSVTLVHLPDGRVIGINDECVALYPSREAFDDVENVDHPMIALV